MTPLARPVVPEEYGSVARSTAGSMCTSGGAAVVASRSRSEACPSAPSSTMISETPTPSWATAAFARSRNSEIVIIILAPESRSW